jgi:hypothetical protein
VYCIAANMLGSGCNLLGYYMYHGGINPAGEVSTMQESKDSGYPNDYPVMSYDFQAPLGDFGQVRQSYMKLSLLHGFVNSYGDILAPMVSILPEQNPRDLRDIDTIRCAIRTDGTSGFLFVNNYQRLAQMPDHVDVKFSIILSKETIEIPVPVIPSGCNFIFPFQMRLGDTLLRYALAQPVGVEGDCYSFVKIPGIEPVFCLADGSVMRIEDSCRIGSVTIKVFEQYSWQPAKGQLLGACPVESAVPFTRFEYLHLQDKTREWSVELPEGTAWLKVWCTGNVAHAYCGGKLIADWFCNGTPWVVGTKNLPSKEIIIKIQPLTANDDIYFETNVSFGCGIIQIEAFRENTICI